MTDVIARKDARRMGDDGPSSASPVVRLAPHDFEEFYRTRRDQVYRGLALTLRDRDFAADAVEEAMTRAFQHWRTVRNHRNPEGWAYRVGLNWARSRLRRRQREVPAEDLAWRGVPDPEPADPALSRALERLPMSHRAVVVLRYFYDWSTEDVAEVLGIPQGTVKSRLSRSLEQLGSSLEAGT